MYIKIRVQWTYNDIHNNHYTNVCFCYIVLTIVDLQYILLSYCGVVIIHYCHCNVIIKINIYNYKAYNVFQYCKFQGCIKIRSPCSYVN